MTGLRIYLLRLVAAGLVCAGASALCPKGKQELLRFCCACILALTALAPLAKADLTLPRLSYQAEMQAAADEAVTRAGAALRKQTELDLAADAERFAAESGLTLSAEVYCVTEKGQLRVSSVALRGAEAPAFAAALARRFGIEEDAIVWRN